MNWTFNAWKGGAPVPVDSFSIRRSLTGDTYSTDTVILNGAAVTGEVRITATRDGREVVLLDWKAA